MPKYSGGTKYGTVSRKWNPDGSDIQRNPQAAIPGIRKVTPFKMMRSRDFKISEIPELIKNFTDGEKQQFFQDDQRKSIARYL